MMRTRIIDWLFPILLDLIMAILRWLGFDMNGPIQPLYGVPAP